MKNLITYLNFDGDTRDAITFYHACLGGELNITSFKDAKMDVPKGSEDRVIHANLMRKGGAFLMASDTLPGMPFKQGSNFAINIECENIPEIDRLFKALGEGGKVTHPLQDTFWNARFGSLTDRFGVNWMFNCELPKQA
jgi:PhnB protein